MKKVLLTVAIILSLCFPAFADTPIYCPHCKLHLYNYQKEIVPGALLEAEDFKPTNDLIPQPQEAYPMICPLCKSPLNGYEWFFREKNRPPPKMVYSAITLLTKDENGNFKFVPYDFNPEDWEGKH